MRLIIKKKKKKEKSHVSPVDKRFSCVASAISDAEQSVATRCRWHSIFQQFFPFSNSSGRSKRYVTFFANNLRNTWRIARLADRRGSGEREQVSSQGGIYVATLRLLAKNKTTLPLRSTPQIIRQILYYTILYHICPVCVLETSSRSKRA